MSPKAQCLDFVLSSAIEGVHGKKPKVILDLMSNSPFVYKEVNLSNLLGEYCSLSDVT